MDKGSYRLTPNSATEIPNSQRLVSPNINSLCNKSNFFGASKASDRDLVTLLLNEVARQNQVIEKLQRQSLTDNVTGLGNRRAFFEEFSRTDSMSSPYLAYIDIDNFKQLNDLYGHKTGDFILLCFARAVIKVLSESERAYRLGGDEFVIVFDHPKPAERLAQLQQLLYRYSHRYAAEISWGLVNVETDTAADTLLHRADIEMYCQKSQKKRLGSRPCRGAGVSNRHRSAACHS